MGELIRPLFVGVLVFPFLIALLLLGLRHGSEKTLSRVSLLGSYTWFLATMGLVGLWLFSGRETLSYYFGQLYQTDTYEFPILFLLDKTSATFLAVTVLLGALVIKYCRHYLHREVGYARFFITIFGFLGGMAVLVTSGTFELLFAGWEILGLSSFLLIGFYRDRAMAQRNAFTAFCVYRICDVGLLLGSWLGHLLWHRTISFLEMTTLGPAAVTQIGFVSLFLLSGLIILAASGKSAQFPFSFWLPRAMEGPTPSSAIFYGALSIHAGVLLLLRTYPIWSAHWSTRVLVAVVGLVSALAATLTGRIQANIKAQIGYASIVQIGLMWIELALGLPEFVLFHFSANAMLRCYQLLVSPSVVAHLLRVQAASLDGIKLSDWSLERRWIPKTLQTAVYVFSLNEGYVDHSLRSFGRRLRRALTRFVTFGDQAAVQWIAVVLVLAALIAQGWWGEGNASPLLEVAFTGLMLIASLRALGEQTRPFRAWGALGFSSLLASSAVLATGFDAWQDVLVHVLGIVPSWLLGALALKMLVPGYSVALDRFHGRTRHRPVASFLFLLGVIGISGFPITSAFLGEDLLLHHATETDLGLALMISVAFVVNGIAAMKLFSRVCLGPEERVLA